MKTGMMWYGGAARELGEVIADGATYYRNKYGSRPNVAFVHPDELKRLKFAPEGINVQPNGMVQKNYVWMGVK